MPAHEFEKIVQQKMESLKVSPSDAVWNTVEVEIRRTRRRRRLLLALPLLLLTGIGSFWGWQQFQPSSVVQTEKNASNDKEHSTPGTAATGLPQAGPAEQDHGQPGHLTPAGQPQQIPSSVEVGPEHQADQPALSKVSDKFTGDATADNTLSNRRPLNSLQKKSAGSRKNRSSNHTSAQQQQPLNKEDRPLPSGLSVKNSQLPSAEAKPLNNTQESFEQDWVFSNRIGLERSPLDKPAVSARQPLVSANLSQPAAKKTIRIPIPSKWHWGVTANAGTSKLVDGTLKGAFDKSLGPVTGSYLIDTSLGRPGPVGLPSLAPNPSSVKPALHVGLGLFVKRDLNSRLSISTGIEYNYYTTRIHVGEKVDSSRIVNTSNSTLNVDRFYKNEMSGRYTNKYHFIEIPLTVEYLFNKNMPVPFSVFGGATLGYMFSTNALQYDHFYGVYYRDDKSFNKTQIGVQAGVRFQVTRHGRQALEIGPVFNYKLKNMANDNSGNTSHLLSGAVNLRWHLR